MLLSDWSFEDPYAILRNLRFADDYYQRDRRTATDFLRDARERGYGKAAADDAMWAAMRMSKTDIADVTAATYTYLMNGHDAAQNWSAQFEPGERVRLRFINGSAMTYFNVRLPGLPMTVVQADGQNIKPVEVDEFQIGVAETYDVVRRAAARCLYHHGRVDGSQRLRARHADVTPRRRGRGAAAARTAALNNGRHGHAASWWWRPCAPPYAGRRAQSPIGAGRRQPRGVCFPADSTTPASDSTRWVIAC